MKTTYLPFVILAILFVAGCNQREKELEQEKSALLITADSLNRVIAQRDAYFDEVVRMIDQVHTSLEGAREKEALIMKETGESSGKFIATADQAKARLVEQITSIDATLKENRKKISQLQSRVKSFQKEFAGLNEAIENLKKNLEEREKNIAALEARVSGLENEVVEKSRVIADREAVIGTQQTELNTVYYITGKRNELEQMGIITDEGGFPWGLFGSATVLATSLDESNFKPFDKTREQTIEIYGSIDEIVPKRSENLYAMNETGDGHSDITILDPRSFWQEKYLVVITD